MTEKRVALLIANSQYEDPDLRQLIGPTQDIEALTRVLVDQTIGNFEVQSLLNESAYKISQEIEAFFDNRKQNDLLLLYFSGHGIKDEEGRLYFATIDTKRERLHSTAVSASFINEMMYHSRSRRQVLLLDCCYSGAFARGMVVRANKDVGTGEYFKEGRGHVVLTASDALQYSFEGDKIDGEGVRSVFTHALVHGLVTGKADLDGDGQITFDELYDYIYDRVTYQMPQQRPRKWVFDVQGEIIIARNPNPVIIPAELPSELRQAIDDPRPWVREGAVHELGRLLHGSHPGLALAAQEALKRLADDDSRRVSAISVESLATYVETRHLGEEDETKREEQERQGREKAEAERTARARAERERVARNKAEAKAEQPVVTTGRGVEPPVLPDMSSSPATQAVSRVKNYFLIERTYSEWVLGLKWILASTMGWAVGEAIYEGVGGPVGGAVIGAVVGIMQWLVLRRQVSQAGWWVLASSVGVAVGFFVAGPVNLFGTVFEAVTGVVVGAVIGAVVGITQWLVLRRQVSQAGWWVLASSVGVAVGWPVGVAVSLVGAVVGAMVGAMNGAITGMALVWLLRHPILETKQRE